VSATADVVTHELSETAPELVWLEGMAMSSGATRALREPACEPRARESGARSRTSTRRRPEAVAVAKLARYDFLCEYDGGTRSRWREEARWVRTSNRGI
jgi:hypothetical protein